MTSRVHALKLSGLDGYEAIEAVRSLLDDRSVPDLSSLVVLDDTAILLEHTTAFERLLTSGRLNHLVCVAIGPAADGDRLITVPGGISSGQGSAVLWVSDPVGVDWRLAASSVPTMRPPASLSGLHHLVELLSAVEVFDLVRDLVLDLPGGVASPGLRLDEASEMVNAFPFALAVAIRRLTESQVMAASRLEPAESLVAQLGDHLGAAQLDPTGKLAQACERCQAEAEAALVALDELAGIGGLFGVGEPAIRAREQVVSAGEALHELKDMVCGLFEYAHAPAGLNERQRQRLIEVGVRLLARNGGPRKDSGAGQVGAASLSLPEAVTKAAVDAVDAGDPLLSIVERFALAERKLSPRGSRVYEADVEKCCPPSLVRRLMQPPAPPDPQQWMPLAGTCAAALAALSGKPGIAIGAVAALLWVGVVALGVGKRVGANVARSRVLLAVNLVAALAGAAIGVSIGYLTNPPVPAAAAGLALAVLVMLLAAVRSWHARVIAWKHSIWPNEAVEAAGAIAELVTKVASSEWSADAAALEAVARTKISLEGVLDQLRDYASDVEAGNGDSARRQQARLSSSFEPTLRDLVSSVLAAQPARGHSDGQAAYRHVKAKTADLISQWTTIAIERGPFARPQFATASERDDSYIDEEDLGTITSAANHDPDGEMWQLCAPSDLAMLDTEGRKGVVIFAPRMMRQALVRQLPSDTVWTSSGQYAGVLRLVPLRPGRVILDWSGASDPEPAQ